MECCADCGNMAGEGVSLKACMSCKLVKYCNAKCQRNHWPKHKKICKRRAAELYDEKLFKDPPPKEECPICFLPMPIKMISCVSLPPATTSSVPINDYANANAALAQFGPEQYYSCCGKSICNGCIYSVCMSENNRTCPFCKAETMGRTDKEVVGEMMKRAEANDAFATFALANQYFEGQLGLLQDEEKAMQLWTQAAELGLSHAHFNLGAYYHKGGDYKKEKFHYEAAAMAGHEGARYNLGCVEEKSRNMVRAIKHWTIAASAGHHKAMNALIGAFKGGVVSRVEIESFLTAYNKSCAEMRSEARDTFIRMTADRIGGR